MIKRTKKKLKILDKYLIVCEGEVTEGLYFNGIRKNKRLPASLIDVREGYGVPLTVVRAAVAFKQENQTSSIDSPENLFKEVWCVFDRDDHPSIPAAFQLANANGIKIAFSNPCFELFIILHFRSYRRPEHRKKVASDLRIYIPGYEKRFDYQALKLGERFVTHARAGCAQVDKPAPPLTAVPPAPYTSVCNLVEMLTQLPSSPYIG